MNKTRYIKCAHCGGYFTPQRKTARYCKDKCRKAAHVAKNKLPKIEIDGFTKAENAWLPEVHKHWPRLYDLIKLAARSSVKGGRIALWCYMLSNWPELDLPIDLATDVVKVKASDSTRSIVGIGDAA